MIRDLFHSSNPNVQRGIDRVASLMESSTFLSALGPPTSATSLPTEFPIIQDIEYAGRMMTSQEIWDMPEPWPYQYFPGIIEDETGRLQYSNGLPAAERRFIDEVLDARYGLIIERSLELIDKRLRSVNLERFSSGFSSQEEFEFIAYDVFANEIDAYLYGCIQAIYYGKGIENSPVFCRMLEAFETGGMPSGWVGPEPEHGGDPVACIQLLHFGQIAPPTAAT